MKLYLPAVIYMACLFCSCRQPAHTNDNIVIPADSLQQNNPYAALDLSPMDMAWCPANYPIEKMQGNDSMKLTARIVYSRPHKKGRKIFGNDSTCLCPYGKPWRLGANEATEIMFFENVSIAGTNINKGMYVMYCIPHEDRWTIVLNSNLYTWGLHIDQSKDVFKTEIPVMQQSPPLEDFTMAFKETTTGADLVMAWDNAKAVLPVTFLK